jgi:hypothetical protein
MNQTNYLKNIRLTRIVSRRDVIAGGVGSLIAIASTSLNQASAQSRQPNDLKPMDSKMQRFSDRTEIIDAINAVASLLTERTGQLFVGSSRTKSIWTTPRLLVVNPCA